MRLAGRRRGCRDSKCARAAGGFSGRGRDNVGEELLQKGGDCDCACVHGVQGPCRVGRSWMGRTYCSHAEEVVRRLIVCACNDGC